MGSIRTVENIAKLVKLTVSTLQLPASRINIGASQYVTSALTLDKSVTGVGGCDVAVAAGSLYYVYAVVSSGTVYLIASLNSSLPSGFTQARVVGGFTTNSSSQIDRVGEYPGNLAVAGSVSAGGGITTEDTRNHIINGAMEFSQRYGSTLITGNIGADKYVPDRWWCNGTGDVNQTYQRIAVTDLPGFGYALCIKKATATLGGMGPLNQPFEYDNIVPLLGKTVTLSFWYKTPVTPNGNIQCSVSYDASTANLKEPTTTIFLVSVTPSTTWTLFTKTFVVPLTAKSLRVSPLYAQGVTNVNAEFQVTGVMLNIGTSAAPFRRAGGTICGEQILCQRYYQRMTAVGISPFAIGSILSTSGSTATWTLAFPNMRDGATPSCEVSAATEFRAWPGVWAGTSWTGAQPYTFGGLVVVEFQLAITPSQTAASSGYRVYMTASSYIGVSCEL